MDYVKYVLEAGFNFCSFDFTGSGISTGEYVSLGYREAEDVRTVINYLYGEIGVRDVVLWGRSMGAVAALIYSANAHSIVSGLVLDSPFKDLKKLIKESASIKTGMPKFMFEPLMYFVDNSLK